MKDGAVTKLWLRDVLVNEMHLAEALKSGKVKKYVTDFANPVRGWAEHTIVIPHLARFQPRSPEDNCAEDGSPEIMIIRKTATSVIP